LAATRPLTTSPRAGLSPRARTALLLGLPTVIAAVLVLWAIGRLPLWRDEIASVTIVDRPLSSSWHVIVHHESNMALYDVVLGLWQLLGHAEGFLRLPSAAFAIATVPVAALVARRIAGDLAAAVTGGTLALNGMVVAYGQQARGYSLLMLLSACAALALVHAMGAGATRRSWIAWTASIALLPYAHMLGALVVVALVASLVFYGVGRLPWRPLITSLVVAGVAWLPLLAFVAGGDNNRTSWVPPLGRDLVRQTAITLAGRGSLLVVLALATLIVVAGLVAALRSRDVSPERRWHLGLVLCWVALPPILLGIVCLHQQMWVDRYLIGIVPGFCVAAGVAATLVRDRLGTAAAGAAVAVLAAFAVFAAATTAHPAQGAGEDLRAAARFVAAERQPGDAIVYAPAFSRVGILYYLDRTGRPQPADIALDRSAIARGDLFASELAPATVAQRMAQARRIWMVGYGYASDWHPTPEPVTQVAPGVLAKDFHRVEDRRFGAVSAQLYTR
jgi:mannosyltransferase